MHPHRRIRRANQLRQSAVVYAGRRARFGGEAALGCRARGWMRACGCDCCGRGCAGGARSGSRQARAAQPSRAAYGGLSLRQQEEVQRYVVAVFEATREHSRACLALPPLTQCLNHGSPNAALLSILGVLRRPTTPADLPELVSDGRADFPGTYVNYVRRARVAFGISCYVIPGFGISYYVIPGDAGQISAGCAAAETAALRRLEIGPRGADGGGVGRAPARSNSEGETSEATASKGARSSAGWSPTESRASSCTTRRMGQAAGRHARSRPPLARSRT
jgi:hypothetical protein